MKIYFPNDRYDTPEDAKHSIGDKIFFKTRLWFYLKFIRILFKCKKYALKGIYDNALWAKTSFEVFKTLESCGGRFHITGLDNLHIKDKSLVIISNHMSTLETIIFPCIITPVIPITFVVKDSLVSHKIFGPIMRSRNPIVVERKNPRKDFQTVLTQGNEILSTGCSIVIFPQSTRMEVFNSEKFNTLGIKLARRAGTRILPVAVKTDFWGNGKTIKDLGPINRAKPIYMAFGAPMKIENRGAEEHAKTIDFIQYHLDKWQD